MSFLLIWLTISLPFVYQLQQKTNESHLSIQHGSADNEDKGLQDSPFSETTEETTESSTNIFSEFLPESAGAKEIFCNIIEVNKCLHAELYIAYHDELISPPPEA